MDMALSNITMMQIIIFLTVAEEQGFARAAKKLHMTQSAVTKSIAKLEQDLDVTFFYRTTRTFELSESAVMLYNSFKPHFIAMQKSFHEAYTFSHQNRQVIRIALLNTTNPKTYFDFYAKRFSQICPEVELDVVSDSLENQRLFMSQYKYDIIFIPDFEHYELDRRNLPWKWVAKAPVQIIMSKEHPLAGRHSLTLDDIIDERYVIIDDHQNPNYLEYLRRLCGSRGRYPDIAKKYYSTSAIHSILKLDGILLVDNFFVLQNIEGIVRIPLEEYENGLICTWNEPFRTNSIKQFIKMMD